MVASCNSRQCSYGVKDIKLWTNFFKTDSYLNANLKSWRCWNLLYFCRYNRTVNTGKKFKPKRLLTKLKHNTQNRINVKLDNANMTILAQPTQSKIYTSWISARTLAVPSAKKMRIHNNSPLNCSVQCSNVSLKEHS